MHDSNRGPGADDGAGSSSSHLPAVYDRLRAIASSYLARLRPGQSVQPTDLVHDVYLKLSESERSDWRSKSQFLAVASKSIRNLLIDRVRAKAAQKRGGDRQRVTLSTMVDRDDDAEVDLLALHEAMERLAEANERRARIVEMRFFGGMNSEEIGDCLDTSSRTVRRELRIAQAWLLRELEREGFEP